MSAQPHPRLTEEEYLKLDRASEFKSEFINGFMYPMSEGRAMSGGSYPHVRIIVNIASEMHQALKDKDCEVFASELRLRVSPQGLYTYPDLAVVCGRPKFADDQKDTLTNPTLLIEVLSPSTEARDRGFKFQQYTYIGSLQEYALVSQSEPRVEIFRRQPSGDWLFSAIDGLDSTSRFESIGCQIPLAEIYRKVTFPEHPFAGH